MSLYWLFLIIPAAVVVLLFAIYFFNLDMKLVAVIYKALSKLLIMKKRRLAYNGII